MKCEKCKTRTVHEKFNENTPLCLACWCEWIEQENPSRVRDLYADGCEELGRPMLPPRYVDGFEFGGDDD